MSALILTQTLFVSLAKLLNFTIILIYLSICVLRRVSIGSNDLYDTPQEQLLYYGPGDTGNKACKIR